MDLRAEPLVLSVPAIEAKRYYSVQLCDCNCYNYGYVGSRATGDDAGDYIVVGPDWKGETPAGIKKVFRGSTQFFIAIYRTRLFNPGDMDNVIKVQAGYKLQPLSKHLNHAPPPPAPAVTFPKINKDLVKKNFFEFLDFMLQIAFAQPLEKDIRTKLAKTGVGAGKTFSFKDLSLKQKAEIALGMKQGDRKIEEAITRAGVGMNG